jgi:transposase
MVDDIPSGKITVMDQRSYIKIETLRDITPTQIYESLREVCGDYTIDRSTISRWSQRFREGRIAVEDKQHLGRPRSSTDYTSAVIIANVLEEDRCMTREEIARESGIPKSSVHRIVTEHLQKRKVSARWVRHKLSDEQKAQRKGTATLLLSCFQQKGDPFLRCIAAIDETWIRDFEPELKSQSAQWKHPSSPRTSKCRRQQSKVKQMVIMAYDHEGVIATDRVPTGVCHCRLLSNIFA